MQKYINPEYYEAIIQLRPIKEDLLNYVIGLIEKRSDVFISKIIENKFGHDVYVSDRKYAMSIGKKLKDKFKGGSLKTSKSLYGYNRQKSKMKFRVVICFRID